MVPGHAWVMGLTIVTCVKPWHSTDVAQPSISTYHEEQALLPCSHFESETLLKPACPHNRPWVVCHKRFFLPQENGCIYWDLRLLVWRTGINHGRSWDPLSVRQCVIWTCTDVCSSGEKWGTTGLNIIMNLFIALEFYNFDSKMNRLFPWRFWPGPWKSSK